MAGGGRAAIEAGHLLSYLLRWRGQSAMNPWWPQYFWQDVCRMETPSGIEPDVLRVLRTAGYAGASTLSVPGGFLQSELESFREAGAPCTGAGVGLSCDDPAAFADFDWANAAWDSELPPDLKRSAPEIYRAIRSEGQRSVREWLTSQ